MELEIDFVRVVRDGREDLFVAVVFVGFAMREGAVVVVTVMM